MLYGRDDELAQIGRLIEGARDGHSGALWVTGDAGVGKTALPAALTIEQRAGKLGTGAFQVGTLPVTSRVQDAFAGNIVALPERTRLLLLIADADDTGDLAARMLGAALEDLAPPSRPAWSGSTGRCGSGAR